MNDYTQNVLFPAYDKSNMTINKSGYKGSDGNYYPGVGLAQWTGGRGYKLFQYAKQQGTGWGNLDTQLSFFDSEMNGGYSSTRDKLKGAGSVADATRYMLDGYEMSEGFSKKKPSWYNKRLGYAQGYYNKYAGGSGGTSGGRPIKPIRSSTDSLSQKQQALLGGGRGEVSASAQSLESSSSTFSTSHTSPKQMADTSKELSQVFKLMVEYLSQIADNTGTTNTELEALNEKDFGNKYSQTNSTTNVIDNSSKKTASENTNSQSTADRSEYALAKRVAAGLLS
jgi:hypothetical protein